MDHVLILKAGDIRMDGDEQRDTSPTVKSMECSRVYPKEKNKPIFTSWTSVKFLFGERILRSDLMHMQFRRRL